MIIVFSVRVIEIEEYGRGLPSKKILFTSSMRKTFLVHLNLWKIVEIFVFAYI